jgi:cysteine desulfurase / selenocysteine lyase
MAPNLTYKPYNSRASTVDKAYLDARDMVNRASLAARFAPYRKLVPLTSQPGLVYLNSSFSPPSNLIIHEAITAYSHDALRCPHPKPQWQAAAEELRGLVARYLNTEPTNIAFTRDTTEGLGNFIHSLPLSPGDNVVVLDSEHPNHVYGWMALRSIGVEVRQVPSIAEAEKSGRVQAATAETFAPFVDGRTKAIGLSSIMFHSGQKNDVAGICAAFRPRGVHVLLDATQQVGFAAIDVRALGVSAAAFSLHKGLNCPTGLACLYVDPAIIAELDPVPPIVGFGAVRNTRADLLVPKDAVVYHPNASRFDHLNMNLVAAVAGRAFLKFYLESLGVAELEEYLYSLGDQLREECAKLCITIVGPTDRDGHAPHLYILKLLDPAWAEFLRENGIYATSYRLGVRVSLGFYNDFSDIKRLSRVLKEGISQGFPIM